jgi:hypothetical protein
MRALSLLVLLPSLALADASITAAPSAVACGTPAWREMAQAIEAYCRHEAAPSERLGCSVARHAFARCGDGELRRELGDRGEVQASGAIRDPRDAGYAWLLDFIHTRGRWRLARFRYAYDDCDALGVPPPPRGQVRLADVRLTPS